MTPPMIYFFYFADMEDSASLGSDMSTISDLQEAVRNVLPFLLPRNRCLLETSAINPGVWGRAVKIGHAERYALLK